MKIKLIFFAVIISLNANARPGPGIGRDAVVCRNQQGNVLSAELLDYYEGRINRGITYNFEENMSDAEFFEMISKKLAPLFNERNESHNILKHSQILSPILEYYRQANVFINGGFMFTSDKLVDIQDYQDVIPPKGCTVEQVLIRQETHIPTDPKYIIQKDILLAMDEDSVRGLILHDAFLEYGIGQDLRDATETRYIIQKISSVSVRDLSYRFLYESFKDIVHTFNSKYELTPFTELPSGELVYNSHGGKYVLNDEDGKIDRDKTLKYIKLKLLVHLDVESLTGGRCPKGAVLTATHQRGREKSSIPYSTCLKSVELYPGVNHLTLEIPPQIFLGSNYRLKSQIGSYTDTSIDLFKFSRVTFGYKQSTTVLVDLDEKSHWFVKIIK